MTKYPTCLTEIGQRGDGEALNDERLLVCQYQHDMLTIAGAEGLDLSLLRGTLAHSVVHDMYCDHNLPSTFCELLRRHLESSARPLVRILVWRRWHESLLSPEIRKLMREFRDQLQVKFSNDEDRAQSVNHFSIAHAKEDFARPVLLRWEDLHPVDADASFPATLSFLPPASERKEVHKQYLANTHAAQLLRMFNTLFAVASPVSVAPGEVPGAKSNGEAHSAAGATAGV